MSANPGLLDVPLRDTEDRPATLGQVAGGGPLLVVFLRHFG